VGLDSVVSRVTAMGWEVQGLNLVGGKIFCTHPDKPLGVPSLLYNGYRAICVAKAGWAWH
jgi:hypothetical protein